MTSLFLMLSRWPLGALHALGAVLGWLVFLASPTYRRRFLAHAAQAGYRFGEVRAAVAHAGRLVAELPRLWFGRPVPVRWEGAEHIEVALSQARGLVFLTPHLGCFEVTAQAYAARFAPAHGPITVLFRPSRQAALREVVARSRAREGLAAAPATLAGVKQLLKALRAGHAVGLLPDQVPPQGLGVWAPFFGRPAYTMTLAARLARQSGAAVLLAWGERLPRAAGFVVHVQPFDHPLSEDATEAATQINAAMEALIRRRPEQYLWAYARYKTPREELHHDDA